MFKFARWIGSTLTTVVGLYVFFFVPIGRRTLFDHAKRVFTTPEAREFGDEMRNASVRVAARTRDEVEGVLRDGVLHGPDGGVRTVAAEEPPSPPPPHLEPHLNANHELSLNVRWADGGAPSQLLRQHGARALRRIAGH